jgi:nucleotide-binding universal stress UspA family protein
MLFIPLLYVLFTFSRNRLGEPSPEMDYLGQLDAAQLAGFGFGQMAIDATSSNGRQAGKRVEVSWQPDPKEQSHWREERVEIKRMAVLLDGSEYAAEALPWAKTISKASNIDITLLSSVKNQTQSQQEQFESIAAERESYLRSVVDKLQKDGYSVSFTIQPGFIAQATGDVIDDNGIDLVVTSTRGKSGTENWITGGVSRKLVHDIDKPVLLVTSSVGASSELPQIQRLLVALDGSIKSEQVLPYARMLGKSLNCELILMSVPAVPSVKNYRAPADVVETIRTKAVVNMQKFLEAVARSLREEGLVVRTIVAGSMPARTIVETALKEDVDMIMITSKGRGGLDYIMVGSVAQRIVENTEIPVFIVPIIDN